LYRARPNCSHSHCRRARRWPKPEPTGPQPITRALGPGNTQGNARQVPRFGGGGAIFGAPGGGLLPLLSPGPISKKGAPWPGEKSQTWRVSHRPSRRRRDAGGPRQSLRPPANQRRPISCPPQSSCGRQFAPTKAAADQWFFPRAGPGRCSRSPYFWRATHFPPLFL